MAFVLRRQPEFSPKHAAYPYQLDAIRAVKDLPYASHRNRLRQAKVSIRQAESAQLLVQSGYLLPEDAAIVLERSREQMSRVEATLTELQIASPSSSPCDDLDLSNGPADPSHPERLNGLSPDSVRALQSAFGALATTLPPQSAFDLIQSILSRISDRGAALDPEASL